jgi:hypothetical protein
MKGKSGKNVTILVKKMLLFSHPSTHDSTPTPKILDTPSFLLDERKGKSLASSR